MINEEKRYKEVLERAKKELYACSSYNCDAARQIFRLFPELLSIKNEEIKNNIIKLLRFVRDTYHEYSDACNEAIAWVKNQSEQNNSWNEEDEDSLDIAIRIIQNGGDDCAAILDSDKALRWLKSLKYRVRPQLKWKKAKEDRCLGSDWAVKFTKDGNITFSDVVYKGEYFIILQSLKTLPKEE